MKRRLKILVLIVGFAVWAPALNACPQCFGSTPFANGLIWAAIFVLPLPFLLVGGLFFWIRRQSREEESRLVPPGSREVTSSENKKP